MARSSAPPGSGIFLEDAKALATFVQRTSAESARQAREAFLEDHVSTVYSLLTDDHAKFLRLDDLIAAVYKLIEGLLPSDIELELEAKLPLAEQKGLAIDVMLFLSYVLNHKASGEHLCQAMRLPRADSIERLADFAKSGQLTLAAASLERIDKASFLTLNHPETLNAEDERSLEDVEIAVDLALLDPHTEVVVLRGAPIDKYGGHRAFCSGINLTRLQDGKISPLWYLQRELGVLHKIYRGLAQPKIVSEASEETQEKPWIAQLDKFAIGGGCQYLLVMDSIVAGTDAFLSLPARKEGIIPGAANLRLPRFVGERLARQMVLADRRIACDSDEGRMLCDRIVAPEKVESSVQALIDELMNSGVVSFAANRRAFRLVQEPLDMFRRYMALYAHEQAFCHFSPALSDNLRRHWRGASGH
ncbi:MAG: enoyl-CoA hydratase/isomerase family protein [Sterolibacterium sp.]